MLEPQQIRKFCERRYPQFLRSIVTGDAFFPLDVPFGRPAAAHDHRQLDSEVRALANSDLGYRINWATRRFRWTGEQDIPSRVWFEDSDGYLQAIRKHAEVETFRSDIELTRIQCPALLGWVAKHPLKLIEQSSRWSGLVKVCSYFLEHPRPGVFPRELPIEVGTKFIEENEPILDSLLQHVFGSKSESQDGQRFADRYGLRTEEPLVRFRVLDKSLCQELGLITDDISVPVSKMRDFGWADLLIIITENKMNFLTLPCFPRALGIWGGGNAAQLLKSVLWLQSCRIIYWGDIDVHGFHIVSRLRGKFPQLRSVMMDTPTLEKFLSLAVLAKPSKYEETKLLTIEEGAVYTRVRDAKILLEQEKISQPYALDCLQRVVNAPKGCGAEVGSAIRAL